MINRRVFIKKCIAIYGSLLLIPACKNNDNKQKYNCFTNNESECLESICEQFIPTDDFPGAKETGIINFIDRLLYTRFPELKIKYTKGIYSLESYTNTIFKKSFKDLPWDIQMSILQKMENKQLPEKYWTDISQKEFFEMVLRNTMQGYYGSPRHGGNKNYTSFRMMKLDYPPLIGQNRYE